MTIKHFIIIIVMALPITTTVWAGDTKPTAQPTLTNEELNSSLFEAAKSGSPEEIESLLEAEANPNATDEYGNTPLHFAADYNSNLEVTKALLDKGADPNATDNVGHTPLHFAARYNSPEVTEALLEGGADPNATTEYGNTPLQHTEQRIDSPEKTKIIGMLEKAMADVEE